MKNVDDGKEDDNAEEFVVVYSLAKEDPETYLKIPEVKIEKIVLDIDEYTTDYEAEPYKIFGMFKGGDQIYVRDEKRTGIKIFSTQDGS
jgi:hypothetical protein